MDNILGILFVGGLFWCWWDSVKSKEIAKLTGQRACQESDVQFLDDTVRLDKIRIKRNSRGQMNFLRIYHYEFTSTGEARYTGTITLLGKFVTDTAMEAYRMN